MHEFKDFAELRLRKRTCITTYISYFVIKIFFFMFAGICLNFLNGEGPHHLSQFTVWAMIGISLLGFLFLFAASYSLTINQTQLENFMVAKGLTLCGVQVWKREFRNVSNVFYKNVSGATGDEETLSLFVETSEGKIECLTPMLWHLIFGFSNMELVKLRSDFADMRETVEGTHKSS